MHALHGSTDWHLQVLKGTPNFLPNVPAKFNVQSRLDPDSPHAFSQKPAMPLHALCTFCPFRISFAMMDASRPRRWPLQSTIVSFWNIWTLQSHVASRASVGKSKLTFIPLLHAHQDNCFKFWKKRFNPQNQYVRTALPPSVSARYRVCAGDRPNLSSLELLDTINTGTCTKQSRVRTHTPSQGPSAQPPDVYHQMNIHTY